MIHPHTITKKTSKKGLGVFATEQIKKGEVVWNDTGLIEKNLQKMN